MDIKQYIEKAVKNNRLKLESGQRNWRKYFISITELVWGRNQVDGYKIEVYDEQYRRHLASVLIDSNY